MLKLAGCLDGALIRTNLQVHFTNHHVQDIIVILGEGNRPYPRGPQCNMFVTQKALNCRQLATAFCRRGMETKWSRLAEEEARSGKEKSTNTYGAPPSPRSPPSNTWGEFSRQRMMTGQQ